MLQTLTNVRLRLKWAWKIMRSANFVVLADTESFIYLGSVDPNSFTDALSVAGQRQALDEFDAHLKQVMLHHDLAVDDVLSQTEGGISAKTKRKATADTGRKPRRNGSKKVGINKPRA